MEKITTIEELESLYGTPVPLALDKVVPRLTPLYHEWIRASRFLVLTTVGPEGCDASPRGDDGSVVTIADDRTLLMPDWKGNKSWTPEIGQCDKVEPVLRLQEPFYVEETQFFS